MLPNDVFYLCAVILVCFLFLILEEYFHYRKTTNDPLVQALQQLEPNKTIHQQAQSFLEVRYQFKDRFQIMQEQPDNPELHWVMIDGKKFLYSQTVNEILRGLK